MGLMNLMRLKSMSRQRDKKRQRRQAHELIALRAKREGSPCQRDDDSPCADIGMHSGPSLPEDIWHHIHSLMPMRDAARVACVSHSFLCSWRCHPNLNFSSETLGLNKNACGKDESTTDFYGQVDHILKRHTCIGVKRLKIQIDSACSAKDSCYLNNWIQDIVRPGFEELTIILVNYKAKYNFPCSLLMNGSGDSIRYLHLANCSFHPKVTLGGFRSLTRLHLCLVVITEKELGSLLSCSPALERLELSDCHRIVCLKVPRLLQRLSYLEVLWCEKLKVIENEAPNVSSFSFGGDGPLQLSLGETLQMKSLTMYRSDYIFHARATLPSDMPNLKALTIYSNREATNVPMLPSKFICLRHLSISLTQARISPAYDYLSLASFFYSAPSLETFHLRVCRQHMENVPIFADPADLRSLREEQHHSLKSVRITEFSSAKSLVELTCHILESATSLECLTLEAPQSSLRCSTPGNNTGKCSPLATDLLMEGHRGILALRRYIEPRVPSTVKLHILEPCSCHTTEL